MTIAWVDPNDGRVLRTAADDSAPPRPDAVAVSPAPESGKQIWDFASKTWGPVPSPPPSKDETLVVELQAATTLPALKAALIKQFS